MVSPEEETELAVEMFNVLVEQEKAQDGSRNPSYSQREKNRLDAESEKLQSKFNRLAKKTKGEAEVRKASKGAAYSLAQYYLSKYYPSGSMTENKDDIPSLFKFARALVGQTITTPFGPIEIESVYNFVIEMGINGGRTEQYSRDKLKIGYTRAKKDIKDKN